MPVLDRQVAVVTGAGRGFGRSIALGLAEAGAAVVVTARTQAQLDETVRLIAAKGGRGHAVAGDVTSAADVGRVRAETAARFGDVSLVVHNAGVPWPFGPTWEVEPQRWWDAQSIHVQGAMHYIHAFVPGMIERSFGHVILVASGAGRGVRANMSGYALAKATQIRLASFLAEEARPHNVFAFSITPGNVLTELSELTVNDPDAQKYAPDFVAGLRRRMDAGEDGSEGLRRCAELCVALASGQFDGLSGQYLTPEDDLSAMLKQATG